MAEEIKIWKTKDNKQFSTKEKAEEHEELYDFFEFLKMQTCYSASCAMNKCFIEYEMKNGSVDWKVNCLVDGGYNIEQTLRSYKEIKEYFEKLFSEKSKPKKDFKEDHIDLSKNMKRKLKQLEMK